LWVSPVQYNPVTQTLIHYESLKIRVYKNTDAGENEGTGQSTRAESRAFTGIYKKLFANYNKNLLSVDNSAIQPEKMLIIVKDDLQDALTPLVEWKRQMGIHTTVVPLSETGANTPAALFNYVQNYYNDHGITYLLLVGDENAITPMVRPNSIYSCDNCLGYMTGNDHFPEILVGRFHASNVAQLQIMINRNLDYEKTPLVDATNNWCATGMTSTSNQGQGIGDDNQADYEQGNEWKAKHLQHGFDKYWEFYDGNQSAISPTPGDETADKPGDPINTELVAQMNGRGVSLYNYTGHGWEQGLVSGNFNTDAVASLRNNHRYPIIVAVACCAGNFTNGECLGEALQRAGNPTSGEAWGSIAAFLSSDFQSWAPPMEGQDGMNQYLLDANGTTSVPVISSMAAYGNALMIAAYNQGGEEMADVWNPFCEPTLMPRTQLPQVLQVAHNTTIELGSASLSVSCPVEGALVSLFGQGQTLAVSIVENGVANFQFAPLQNPEDLVITGTQFNYIPYQGTISVIVSNGAFLVNQSVIAHDLTGNNNELADYGETITLDVTLSNVGTTPALEATGHLSTTDPSVTILNNTAAFGDIADSTATSLSGAFSYAVNDHVTNGHLVSFVLDLAYSNGQTGSFTFSQKLLAPVLTIGSYTITEGPGADNDGYFESGETLILTINNNNTGGSTSSAATGTLTTAASWLTISPQTNLGAIAAGAEAPAIFNISISGNAPVSARIGLQYALVAGSYGATEILSKIVINPIVENFESHNFNSFPWSMSGNKPWLTTILAPYQGANCARSGYITHNQSSVMSLTMDVTNDDVISFARKTKCEQDYDFLRFYIDDVLQAEWSGTLEWQEVEFPVSAGVHTIKWSFEKDAIGSVYPDQVYVDEIILPAHQVVVSTTNPAGLNFQSQIAPNPAKDATALLLQLPSDTEINYYLTDAAGHKILTVFGLSLSAGDHRLELPVSTLSSGMYFLSVGDRSSVVTHKVILR
jgi:uncharacterized repeat protein (TIGR01451 family)